MTAARILNQCIDPEMGALLVPYGLGTLGPEDADRFEDHLIHCAFCRHETETSSSLFNEFHDLRPKLVEHLKATGQDFESQMWHLEHRAVSDARAPQVQCTPLVERLRHIGRRLWNQWVLAPVAVAATVMFFLLSHFQSTPVVHQPVSLPNSSPSPNVAQQPIQPENPSLPPSDTQQPKPQYVLLPPAVSDLAILSRPPLDDMGLRSLAPSTAFDTLFAKGTEAYNGKRFPAAKRYFGEASKLDTKDCTAWLYLGISASLSHDPKTALQALSKANSLCGKGSRLKSEFYRGLAFWESGQAEHAKETFASLSKQTDDSALAAQSDSMLIHLEHTEH